MCVRGWNLFPLSIIEKDSPFLVALVVKNLPANAGDIIDLGSIPGWGRSLGGGHGNPLQYSCQENPMDRGTWRGAYNPWNQKELDDWSDLACMHTQLESRYTFKYINKSFKKKTNLKMFLNSFLLRFLLEGQCPEATASMNRAGHPEETMTYSTWACGQISCEVTWRFHIGYCWEEIFRDSMGLQYCIKGDTLRLKILHL